MVLCLFCNRRISYCNMKRELFSLVYRDAHLQMHHPMGNEQPLWSNWAILQYLLWQKCSGQSRLQNVWTLMGRMYVFKDWLPCYLNMVKMLRQMKMVSLLPPEQIFFTWCFILVCLWTRIEIWTIRCNKVHPPPVFLLQWFYMLIFNWPH